MADKENRSISTMFKDYTVMLAQGLIVCYNLKAYDYFKDWPGVVLTSF